MRVESHDEINFLVGRGKEGISPPCEDMKRRWLFGNKKRVLTRNQINEHIDLYFLTYWGDIN